MEFLVVAVMANDSAETNEANEMMKLVNQKTPGGAGEVEVVKNSDMNSEEQN